MIKGKYKHQCLIAAIVDKDNKKRFTDIAAISSQSERIGKFNTLMRERLRACNVGVYNGRPHYYTGKIYEDMTWEDFGGFVQDIMEEVCMPAQDSLKFLMIIKWCKATIMAKELRVDNSIVVFKNGVFSFKDLTLHEHSPEFVQVTAFDYKYDDRNYPVMWQRFLDEVLPNKKSQKVLQEFLGAVFINRNVDKVKIESMLVLLGRTGANGKSVIFETILGVLGKDNVSTFGMGTLMKGGEKLSGLAAINGKRLNYSSEARCVQIDASNADTIKTLISGEPITARQLYSAPFTAYNIPLMMMNANKMPRILDPSEAIRRRFIIIPFEVSIPLERQDRNLAQNFITEYPGIFNWIIEGRQRFVSNHYQFTQCTEIDRSVDEWYYSSNSVVQFMYYKGYYPRYDRSIDVVQKEVPATDLYKRYINWCCEPNTEYSCVPENANTFGRLMTDAGFKKMRKSTGNIYIVYAYDPNASTINYVDKKTKEKTRNLVAKPIEYNGKLCARGFGGIASCFGISIPTVKKLFDAGEFEGMYEKQGQRTYYDIAAVGTRLRARGIKISPIK
jgi:P4 family phage/plasmid primase-like protien